jgi:hypothetical protein
MSSDGNKDKALELWAKWIEATGRHHTVTESSGNWTITAQRTTTAGKLSCVYTGGVEGMWSGPSPDNLAPAISQGRTPAGLQDAIIEVLQNDLTKIAASKGKEGGTG